MAKKSLIVKEKKRIELVKKYKKQREHLKERIKDMSLSLEERIKTQFALNKLPKDSSRCRITRRCCLTGRSKGVYRKFKISRIMLRSMALNGLLPGVAKSSW
jgi:small subunit ribosomal protein S14